MTPNQFLISLSEAAGFNLIGFAPAKILDTETERLREWVASGYHAGMKYMERSFEKKADVRNVLPSAVSVISLAMNYYPGEFGQLPDKAGKVSRYAWGEDYHNVIGDKCRNIIRSIQKEDPAFEAAYNVDSGPVMDKAWAVRAGIGWLGKNTNVINPKNGSWFFLATIICNREFEYTPRIEDHCGDCTACIDACPTDAIRNAYTVDSNKCISYLTIENKGEIDAGFRGKFENWSFGCDICQEVCPWNIKFSSITRADEFKGGNRILEPEVFENMTDGDFKLKYGNSPILRAKLKGIKRNLEFISDKSVLSPKPEPLN